MKTLIERLRNVADAGLSNGLCYEAADELDRYRKLDEYCDVLLEENVELKAKHERLRAALERIVEIGCVSDYSTALDLGDIARDALSEAGEGE